MRFYIIMTSGEIRREKRFQRRKAERESKKKIFLEKYNDFSLLTSLDNLYRAYHKCTLGVNWKCSVQRYSSKWMENLIETRRKLLTGEEIRTGFVEFNLFERGKMRHIRSVHISERVVQKVLCDQILVPVLSRSLVHDNGASQRKKGTSFALKRLITHLRRFYIKHGSNGYALSIDYSKFFDSIRHDILIEKIKKYVTDERILKIVGNFITAFGNSVSLGLGSQISQICAIYYPSKEIDHFIKEKLRIKYYGRYMDDLYLIHESKDYLKNCLRRIIVESEKIGLKVSLKKTRITALKQGLTFLKGRYLLTDTGKILRLPFRASTVRVRKRLVRFKNLIKKGSINYKDLRNSYESWRGTFRRRFNAWFRVKKNG